MEVQLQSETNLQSTALVPSIRALDAFMKKYQKAPTSSQCCYIFFWSFGINNSNTFSIEKWIPLKPVLGGVGDVALFIISNEQTQ